MKHIGNHSTVNKGYRQIDVTGHKVSSSQQYVFHYFESQKKRISVAANTVM
jgi:hypothetical protein